MGKGLCLAKKEDVFVSSGFNNWKKAHERFVQHAKSDLHRESLMKVELIKTDSVSSLLNKQVMKEQKERQLQLLKHLSSLGLDLLRKRLDDIRSALLFL